MSNPLNLLTIKEFANLEHITVQTALKRVKRGDVPGFRVGFVWLVNRPTKVADPA